MRTMTKTINLVKNKNIQLNSIVKNDLDNLAGVLRFDGVFWWSVQNPSLLLKKWFMYKYSGI